MWFLIAFITRRATDMTGTMSHLDHLPLIIPISDPSASQDSSTSKICLWSIFCPSPVLPPSLSTPPWVKLLPTWAVATPPNQPHWMHPLCPHSNMSSSTSSNLFYITARVLFLKSQSSRETPLFKSLPWLPISPRKKLKFLSLVMKAMVNLTTHLSKTQLVPFSPFLHIF